MQPYANKSGKSGIVAYEITADSITVQFRDGWKYVYNTVTPGAAVLAQLKSLAQAGRGLNSYISGTVKKNFSNKYL
ncbi:MAG: hypothetical protein LKK36_11870 [Ewingella americana]|jgi:hypothetical protein|uniref:hypothetical protein n=1 Tax=Ewingella americana TaxID=41202 RepID=UPI002431777E|nr:hypothetical protein [Ewingella americana]MCI1679568.1 hypothetical protein [Ewingella americana]MCI1854895.1 hypothetical protein [Ewingella americana]MCI1861822.1 hypothetical protein [Ewingella americana]MCI2141703.1 hypothetical protein [Ewingella americana]MCI2164377.1 hypothetical protein [Ewingella americana]